MPRVLRVITRLNRGGPLRQLHALVPALARLGWTGPVVAGRVPAGESDGEADLREVGADIVRLGALRRRLSPVEDVRALRRLLRLVRQTRPDIVHTHMGKAGALGRIAAGIVGVPVVHTVHGHHLQADWPRDVLAAAAERRLGRLADAVIALTPRQRRDLVHTYRILPPERVQVVAPGLDVDALRRRAAAGPPAALAGIGAGDRPLFLWTGRLVPVKDPLLLVRAAARSGRGFRLLLLGGGPMEAAVSEAVVEAGLEEVITILGPVARVEPWIAAADAVVLSSRREGAPLAVIEAQVLGRPVIATTVGGVPDLVTHGVDGLWVPPGDARALAEALDRLAGDAALRRRLGEAGARQAPARHGPERLARETARVYADVLAERGARRATG